MEEAALSVASEALRREAGNIYLCPRCSHAARKDRPAACPVCREEGGAFLLVEPDALEAAVRAQGGSQTEETFDGRSLRWARPALGQLRRIPGERQRSRARLRIEKAARLARLPVITLEFALRHLPEAVPGPDAADRGSRSL